VPTFLVVLEQGWAFLCTSETEPMTGQSTFYKILFVYLGIFTLMHAYFYIRIRRPKKEAGDGAAGESPFHWF
jgi:hypothetical protein